MQRARALFSLAVVLVAAAPAVAAQAADTTCTIRGTSHADVLIGTAGRDVICGFGGDDTLVGKGGSDVLLGGTGDDTLRGGDGADSLNGGAGKDRLYGGPGNDSLLGGTAADVLNGGPGMDTVSYADHTAPVIADLDGLGDDGAAGERDLITTSVENLTGGAGNDRLTGSTGANVLSGGSGADTLAGGPGQDILDGGSGSDLLMGGRGPDVLGGGTGPDTVSYADHTAPVTADLDGQANDGAAGERDLISTSVENLIGGAGSDRLTGSDSANVLSGENGDDTIVGAGGDDTGRGGSGDDILRGGAGDDALYGDGDDDDLDGEADDDNLDGGPGTNWCTVGATDSQNGCVYDELPAQADGQTASPAVVDVTDTDQTITLQAHVIDDTGVALVQFQLNSWNVYGLMASEPRLVSGNRRDGVWEATAIVPRHKPATTFGIDLFLRDRVGRESNRRTEAVLTVTDATPDTTNPTVDDAALDRTAVDVRASDAQVTVTAHITDDLSGVPVDGAFATLFSPSGDGGYVYGCCMYPMQRYAGTPLDGRWRATVRVPQGAVGGDWNVAIVVNDRVGWPQEYLGEDVYRERTAERGPVPGWSLLPNARLSVTGVTDSVAPRVLGLTTDRASVDTLESAQVVHVRVHVLDGEGEGVTEVMGRAGPTEWAPDVPTFPWVYATLAEGTAVDGWWDLAVTFPQGTPPGRYPLISLQITDPSHQRYYAPPAAPGGASADPIGTMTVGDQPWDGVFTVVPR